MLARLFNPGTGIDAIIDFDRGRNPLGKGSFATVWRARLKTDGRPVAVKIMEKSKLRHLNVPASAVETEVNMMRECKNQPDRFVQLLDFVDGTTKYYIVLEFCDGGDLQNAVDNCQLGERQVMPLMQQMLLAIDFLHSKGVCHRDVKPHNFLVRGRILDESVKVKLGDFGIAVRMKSGTLCKEQVGTPAFMAPELHLLPRKSPGYDFKVDVWAVGVVMVFLLANEYPFVDGAGRLLREQLIRGELPLWDNNAFASLFSGFQAAVGMSNRRPSKRARDLIRKLVEPRRERRLSAGAALSHQWFTAPIPDVEESDTEENSTPLLKWDDFQAGLSAFEQEFAWVGKAMSEIPVSVLHSVEPHFDPGDNRLASCVVCYGTSGHLGYRCPMCHYTVCVDCLGRLKDCSCPNCRHKPQEMAMAQAMVQMGRRASETANGLKAGAQQLLENGVSVDSGVVTPLSEEEQRRRGICQVCETPSSATNYICPACSSSLCYDCAKRYIVVPQCPTCGDTERTKEALKNYLATAEYIQQATDLTGSISRRVSKNIDSVRSSLSSVSVPAIGSVPGLEHVSRHVENLTQIRNSVTDRLESASSAQARPSVMTAEDRARHEQCYMCRKATSNFDHVCPCCNAAVCSTCVCVKLKDKLCCPHCHDVDHNFNGMRLIQHAGKAKELWSGIVSLGRDIFSGGPQQSSTGQDDEPEALIPQEARPANAPQATKTPTHTIEGPMGASRKGTVTV